MSTPQRDPGWRPALTPLLLLPWGGASMVNRRNPSSSTLTRVRTVYLRGLVTLVYLCLIRGLWLEPQGSNAAWWWPLQLVYSVASLIAVAWARRRPLDTNEESTLRTSFVASFMLSYALSLSPALMGFVGTFIIGSLLPLLVGAALSVVAFGLNAPTSASVMRRHEDIQRSGSTLSLIDALSEP